ncbi:BT_3987 domain-containing protein [Sphingobacterium sp. NGMCC 1.201703]|uniref:BT_3987 domain-containing protein n=2 Tax=unclassified Sphingobacterium TaxID=2609468 RepID=UPI0039FC24DA
MMRNYISYCVFLFALLLMNGCQKDDRMNNMVDDTIYIRDYKENKITVFDWGKFDYNVTIIKAGIGQKATTVNFQIDEAYLADYNAKEGTNYKLLPMDCYTIGNSALEFGEKDTQRDVHFVFDSDKIKALQGKYKEQYALPCRIVSEGNLLKPLKPEMGAVLLIPSVKDPFLEFISPGLQLDLVKLTPTGAEQVKGEAVVTTNYPNRWDLDYEIEEYPAALDAYNAAIKEEEKEKRLKLLPKAAYQLSQMPYKIEAKKNKGSFEFTIIRKGLVSGTTNLFGEYALPLRIKSVSKNSINPEASTILVPVSFQPPDIARTGWKVIQASSEWIGGGEKENILDGNVDTYWHNIWMGGEPPLPHFLIIDLGKEHEMMAIELIRRANNDLKTVLFEVSTDNKTYIPVGKVDFGTNNPKHTLMTNIPTTKARYLKCIVTESNRPPSSAIAEVYVKGL